jgi:histidinol-phosphate aminotransferase
MTLRVRTAIAELADYSERDLRDAGIRIRMHRNESALVAPEHVVRAIRAIDGEMLRRYPTELQRRVERLLAERLGVGVERVVLASGADDILGGLARVFLDPGDEAIVPVPTFVTYGRVVAVADARLREVPYTQRWSLDADAMVTAANERTRLIILGHPNNPTGDVLRTADLDAIVRALPNIATVIDEVYLSFSPLSLVPYAQQYDNAIVVGSFSKAASLAGVRVGYAVAEPSVAAALRRTLPPYPVAVASLVAADAYLSDSAATELFEEQLRAQTKRSLDAIEAAITPFAQSIARGPATFLLAEFGERAAEIWNALDAAGIRTRLFDTPHLNGAIRFCAVSDAETKDTIACVRAVMK